MDYGLPSYKVNTATLGLFVEYPIFRTSCVNLQMDILLRYHSFNSCRGMFGEGWRFSYDSGITLNAEKTGVLLEKGSGQVLAFQAMPEKVLPPDAYQELKPLGSSRGRLLEYQDYYLFEDRRQEQTFLYAKPSGGGKARLSQVMDNCGNALQVHYGAEPFIQAITDPFGRTIRFLYEDSLYCTGVMLPDGREAAISYGDNGRIEKMVNFAGVPVIFTYDDQSQLNAMIVGKKQRTTSFTYVKQKERGLVHTVTDRNGGVTTYGLLSWNPVTVQVSDPLGYTQKYISRNGLTERVVDGHGRETVIEYANYLPAAVLDKNGNRLLMEYDAQENLIRRTDARGESETFAYDSSGNMTSHTDSLGRVTRYAYDDRKSLIAREAPDGLKTVFHYDEKGRLLRTEMPNGNLITCEYDAFSNLTVIKDRLGDLYRAWYDEHGYQRLGCMDAGGNRTVTAWDAVGRPQKIEYADGTSKSYEYDCCAGLVTRNQLGDTWFFERDLMSNIVKKANPLAGLIVYQYDRGGRLVKEMDELGNGKSYEYDAEGRLLKTTDALGQTVCRSYDANGNLLSVTDERDNCYKFEYKSNNQVWIATDPLGQATVYGYDAANNLSFVITPGQHKISWVYDQNDNIVRKLLDDVPVADLSYDASGNVVRLSEAAGETRYEYDLRDRVTAILYRDRQQVSLAYDGDDHLTEIQYPGGMAVAYSYDSMGRTASVQWDGHEIVFQYDAAAGRTAAEKRSNGVDSRYTYDPAHRLTRVSHGTAGEIFAALNYRYDEAGNMLEEIRRLPWLEAVPDEAEWSRLTCGYDSLNQMTQRNEVLCRSDADGNMVYLGGGRPVRFSYDAESRLLAKSTAQSASEYEYNAFNQLVKVVCDGQAASRHHDLSGRLLFETGERGLTRFIYGNEQLLAAVNADGSVWFYHYDHRGNTAVISDENGNIICAYSYLPYGGIWKKRESRPGNRFTFMGAYGVSDEKDGFYLTASRCYDSAAGRFIQQDPLGFAGGQNLYAYAGGNPVTRVDPEGTSFLLVAALLGGAYLAYKAVGSAKSVNQSGKKYNEKLTELEKARTIRDQYRKAYMSGTISEALLYRAEDNYRQALDKAAKQAAKTASTAVYEYGIPGGGATQEVMKDLTCTAP